MSDNSLNVQQKKATHHKNGPLLIVAGAGTGKTRVITERIGWLIKENLAKPDEILALTFTEKAAGEMEERIDKILPYGYVDLWISTFHGFCQRILKEHALDIGLPNDFKILSETTQWIMVQDNLDKFELDYYKPLGNPTKFIHAMLKLFSRAKDENISPQDYLQYVKDLLLNADSTYFIRTIISDKQIKKMTKNEIKEVVSKDISRQIEIANAYHTYQQLLIENCAMDFGDLIFYVLKLFKERKNILVKYRNQFKYILVDEFQDTNLAQYELIKLLAPSKDNPNITVCGDDDQCLYKWRGASISNIMHFKDDYQNVKNVFLNENYRNPQNILDLSYSFIKQNNPYRLEVKLAQTGKQSLSKKLIAQSEKEGKICRLHGKTLEDEVALTINKIIELYNKNDNSSWSDFAILTRSNNSADPFIKQLERANVPYDYLASRGLYFKPVVMDVLAYLKLLDNYHEQSAMYRVLTWSVWEFTNRDIIEITHQAKKKSISLYDVLENPQDVKKLSSQAIKECHKIINLISKHTVMMRQNKNATEVMQIALAESGYLKDLVRRDDNYSRDQLNYLSQFYKKAKEFEDNNYDSGLKKFIGLVDLEMEAGETGPLAKNMEQMSPDTVKIMTIHSAKGLEFNYVFMVNMVDQRFPSRSRGDVLDLPKELIKEILPVGDVHIQEERRLFYVAMTRAKKGLFLTSAEDYGGARKKKPSIFLKEIKEQGFNLTEDSQAPVIEEKSIKLKQDKTIIQNPPKKFSYSQLNTFESCPYKYKYKYILRVPAKGSGVFSYGQSIHLSLEAFFRKMSEMNVKSQTTLSKNNQKQKAPSIDVLLDLYDQFFIADWYKNSKQKQDYYKQGKQALKDFYKAHIDKWPQVLYLEYPFNLKINHKNQTYVIYGNVDRIDKDGDKIKILDYKTGQPKEKVSAQEKEQLLIYQMAIGGILNYEIKSVNYYYIDNNSTVSFLGDDTQIKKIQNKIISSINQIREGEFPSKPSEFNCQYCDYKDICQYRHK